MFVLEAIRARFGDALLIHFGTEDDPKLLLVDGGPDQVFAFLRRRLVELREERQLAEEEPLPIELAMVSHIDGDHITGLIEMIDELRELADNDQPRPWRIKRFWHNSFDDIIGNNDPLLAATASTDGMTASFGDVDVDLQGASRETRLILATVAEGRQLGKLLRGLQFKRNPPFNSLVMFGHETVANPLDIDGLEITVVGPSKQRLIELQTKWDTDLKKILKKEKEGSPAEVAAFLDKSAANLSSIVVIVKHDGKTMMLTGDSRGDDTLAALKEADLLDADGKIHVDLLKLPHHGSNRNVALNYFQQITADHYVISADGTDDNPDVSTLEMISKARQGDDNFTIYLANPLDDFADADAANNIREFIEAERQAGRKYGFVERKPDDLSVRVALA